MSTPVTRNTTSTYLFRKSTDVARSSDTGHLEPRARRNRVGNHPLRTGELELVFIDLATSAVERVGVRPAQRELPRLRVFDAEVLPVEQRAETFDTVTLVDTLPPRLTAEREHAVGELVDRVLNGLHSPVDNVAALEDRSRRGSRRTPVR